MKDRNVFEYMTVEETLGLGLFLNTITYSLVSDVKSKVFDPIFEELFPEEFFLLKINLGKKTVDIGGALYEIFRWVNYAVLLYFFTKIVGEYIPNPVSFLWLFTPFIVLTAMRKMFVQDSTPTPEASDSSSPGDQITNPSEDTSTDPSLVTASVE